MHPWAWRPDWHGTARQGCGLARSKYGGGALPCADGEWEQQAPKKRASLPGCINILLGKEGGELRVRSPNCSASAMAFTAGTGVRLGRPARVVAKCAFSHGHGFRKAPASCPRRGVRLLKTAPCRAARGLGSPGTATNPRTVLNHAHADDNAGSAQNNILGGQLLPAAQPPARAQKAGPFVSDSGICVGRTWPNLLSAAAATAILFSRLDEGCAIISCC